MVVTEAKQVKNVVHSLVLYRYSVKYVLESVYIIWGCKC